MKLLIVHDPASGVHHKPELLKEARRMCSRYGVLVKIIETGGENELGNLRRAIAKESPDKIALYGGDGTFALGATAAMHTKIPIGIVPCGSSNIMAKELGVSSHCKSALEDLLLSRYYADLDMLEINGSIHCLHFADAGINANIVRALERDPAGANTTYGEHLMNELADIERFKIRVETPEQTTMNEVVMAAFSNGRSFGNGGLLNDIGNPFDGNFEINLIQEMAADLVVKTGLPALEGLIGVGSHKVTMSVHRAKVHFDQPRTVQIDGEPAGEHESLEIKVVESAVKYITTASNPYLG